MNAIRTAARAVRCALAGSWVVLAGCATQEVWEVENAEPVREEAELAPEAVQPETEGVDKGWAVREAQELLKELGYDSGRADGVWRPRTEQAYRAFLRDAGLPAAQRLTPEALQAMRSIAQAQGIRLAAAGADVDVRDGRGWTALMHAVNEGDVSLVELLLKAGADPDMRAPDGATALFMAAVYGHADIVAELVKAGADAHIPGTKGMMPLEVARMRGNPDVVALLREIEERKARERRGALLREAISGGIFRGPYGDGDYYDELTLRFASDGTLESHFRAPGFLDADLRSSGTWRLEDGKLFINTGSSSSFLGT